MNISINNLPNLNYRTLKNNDLKNKQSNINEETSSKVCNFAYMDLVFQARVPNVKPDLKTPLQEKIFNNIKGFLSLPANTRIKNSYSVTSNGKNWQVAMELFKSAKKTDIALKVLDTENSNESIIKMVLNSTGRMVGGSYKDSNTPEMLFSSHSKIRTLVQSGIVYNQDNLNEKMWKKSLSSFNDFKGDCTWWSKEFVAKSELEDFFLEMTKKNNSFIYK